MILWREVLQSYQRATKAVLQLALTCSPWVVATFYYHKTVLGSFLATPYYDHIPFIARLATAESEDIGSHGSAHLLSQVFVSFYQIWIIILCPVIHIELTLNWPRRFLSWQKRRSFRAAPTQQHASSD